MSLIYINTITLKKSAIEAVLKDQVQHLCGKGSTDQLTFLACHRFLTRQHCRLDSLVDRSVARSLHQHVAHRTTAQPGHGQQFECQCQCKLALYNAGLRISC